MNSYQIVDWGKPLQLRLLEKPVPQCDEVLVRITAAGVCHSDVHIRAGYFDLGGGKKLTAEQFGSKLPMTLGHEMAGTIAALGPEAEGQSGLEMGAPVVVYPWIGCGECSHCLDHRDTDCEKQRSLGSRRDGGFSDYVLVPKSRYVVPAGGVDHKLAATFACSGLTAYGALKKMPPMAAGDRLLIIGAGGLGLAAVSIAPLVTNAQMIVADLDDDKLEAATALGAHQVFNSSGDNQAAALKEAAGGPIRGIIDFVGTRQTAELAMAVAVKGSVIVIVGMMGGSLEVPLAMLSPRNLTIRGSHVGTLDELKDLIRFANEGRLQPIPVSTKPMHEINQIIDDLEARRFVGRVVVIPEAHG
ncbi:MAG: alcohol dehydrogenase [Comamonadaceae bacterium]|nr:MAG: alcohol dehydrogenase [Comamonadaceae bacterium]